MNWFVKLGAWLSQGVNGLLLRGSIDESVSGRAHREGWRIERWIDRLFFWQAAHCKAAFERDRREARAMLFSTERENPTSPR
jgi:hypothetical protein